MSNEQTNPEEMMEAEAPAAPEEKTPAPEDGKVLSPEEALAAEQEKVAELKDQVLRAMAEVENTRRRMKKEVLDAQKFGVSNFAKEMLTISDNFARAMEAAPKGDETLTNFISGIEAIERQMGQAFEHFGIKKVNPLGQPFDPHMHSVMMEQEDPSKPAGTIIQVFQPGYMIHDRLLREAQVVVSKGGVKAQKVDTSA